MRLPTPSSSFLAASALQIESSLTPFLYQTATIQSWIGPFKPRMTQEAKRMLRTQTAAARAAYVNGSPDIPLENTSRSTISGRERAIFDKLKDLPAATAGAKKNAKTRAPAKSKNATQQPQPKSSAPASESSRRRDALARKMSAIKSLDDAAIPVCWSESSQDLQLERQAYMLKARRRFEECRTDQELWEALDTWAFRFIRRQYPQGGQQHVSGKAGQESAKGGSPIIQATQPADAEWLTENEAAILTFCYPLLLETFLRTLHTNFPTSPLTFHLLPTIKSLGRQSYVLGASTPLYNALILSAWRLSTPNCFPLIYSLLTEMENAAIEFDYDTLEILGRIKRQGERIVKGDRGEILRRVWEFDSLVSGWSGVVGWIPRVREGLEREALRRAGEEEGSEVGEGTEAYSGEYEGSERPEEWSEDEYGGESDDGTRSIGSERMPALL